MGEGWIGRRIGTYSREYGRLFWKNPLGRKLHVTSAPQGGFVTSLVLFERLWEGSGQQRQGGTGLPASFRDKGARYRAGRCACALDSPNPRGSLDHVAVLHYDGIRRQGTYEGGERENAGRRNCLDQTLHTTMGRSGSGVFSLFLHSLLTLGSYSCFQN